MAKGITEFDVHQAADSLLGTGERPTVEKIRALLGTGSPNTVIRHLDTWWSALGPRLAAQTAISALPEMPQAVAALAQRFWREALEAAAGHATEQVRLERQALQDDRTALSAERTDLQSRMAELQQTADDALHGLKASEAAQLDLRGQLDSAGNLTKDLQLQRDAAISRADRLESQLAAAQQLLAASREATERERAELTEYVRSVENRGHQEVDRLRQQLVATELEREAANRRASRAAAAHDEAVHNARQDATVAREEATRLRALAEASQQQLKALQALPGEVAELRGLLKSASAPLRRASSKPDERNAGAAAQTSKAPQSKPRRAKPLNK